MAISSFCPHCGAEYTPDDTYCSACQHAIDAPASLLHERYRVLEEIGAGGFGAVYQARDSQQNERLVAIKQINLQGLNPQEIIDATDAFNREAEILSQLNHPLLPRIFDRFNDSEHWYLVLTFIEGRTLDAYLQEQVVKNLPARVGLPLGETLNLALHLCDVLHYLHSQHPPIIFRDLKPGNVMRTPDGRFFLIDFGIARRFKPGQAKDTIPFGSPGFAAPEQYGRAQTTPRTDIYSLGALLYCLISSDDPADHPFQFPPLHLYGIDGIRELDTLIQRLVAIDPAQRPADIQEVRAALQKIQTIHTQANTHHIWTPPQSQDPSSSAAGQQQIHFSKVSSGKTTRRNILIGGLVAGGMALIGGIGLYAANTAAISPSTVNYQPQSTYDYTTATPEGIQMTEKTVTNAYPAVPPDGPTYWSSDLNYAAVVHLVSNTVELYIVTTRQPGLLCTVQSAGNLNNGPFQWSPDNKKILFLSDTDTIAVWNAKNGAQIFSAPTITASTTSYATPLAVKWSPNGKYIAAGYPDPNGYGNTHFALLSGDDGTILFQQTYLESESVSTLAWSPDSKYIAFPDTNNVTLDSNQPWSVAIWDTLSYQKVRSISGPTYSYTDTITAIQWSFDGTKLVIVTTDQIQIISADGTLKGTIGAAGTVTNPLWSPDGKYLAGIVKENIVVWDGSTQQPVYLVGIQDNIATFAWSADSKTITTANLTNILTQWTIGS